MSKRYDRDELLKTIRKCNRCGTCQDVCPTYMITGRETDVARSRLRLIRLVAEGRYGWAEEPELAEHLKSCLLCKACVAACPSSVPTDEIMMHARSEINAAAGMPIFNRIAYRGVFSHSARLALLARLARIYQRSFASSLVRKSGFLNLLRTYGQAEELLPPVPARSLKARLPGLLREVAAPRATVAYFTGCAINVFYGRFGAATIGVLQHNGCRVRIPKVSCCGGPHLSGGDFDEAARLARANIDAVLDLEPDAILSDCATCSGIMKEYRLLFADDPEYRDKAERFSGLIRDVNEYLTGIELVPPTIPVEARVAIHDPCHLGRGQQLAAAPRTLLAAIPGLRLSEMADADLCCGGAGSYGAQHPQASRRILERKMSGFAASAADYLATSCPACAMQLEFGLRRHELPGKVVHPVELLARSYGLNSPDDE